MSSRLFDGVEAPSVQSKHHSRVYQHRWYIGPVCGADEGLEERTHPVSSFIPKAISDHRATHLPKVDERTYGMAVSISKAHLQSIKVKSVTMFPPAMSVDAIGE